MGKRYYDNYDYEEAYKEQCKKLEEAEMERWMKEGWVNCLYRTSTYKSTNTESNTTLLESMVYPSFKFKADMPKTEKKRETSPSQSNLNDKNARRYLIRLANINFGKGDIWATFGWNNGLLPETYEDAKKDVVNFIRRINRKRKKLGLENAKYIYIIAFEEYTRPHFHLLISGGIDRDELERMWGKCDRPNTRNISPDENFLLTGLATYITQNPHGTKRWCPSKNLKKPDEPKRSYSKFRKAKVEKMAFDSSVLQAEMEKAYPGFTFLDAEVKHNGVNAAFYIYARIDSVDSIMTKFGVDASQTKNVLGLMTKAGQDTGISMETLETALTTNGASLKEMGLDLTSSVNLLAQMEASGVDVSTALAGMKKAVQNATADGKSADEALTETIDSIKNAKTETEALTIASDLFGKKGAAEMTQAIREGRLSVDDLSGALSDYGDVVSDTFETTLDPWDDAAVAMNNWCAVRV